MPYKTDLDVSTANIGELVAEVLALRADLALIGGDFVLQAIERGWCGDYERWARIINRKTSRPHLIIRDGNDWVVREGDRDEAMTTLDELRAREEPVPAPELLAYAQCNCESCRRGRGESIPAHEDIVVTDPTLDVSGRFSAVEAGVAAPNPTWVYREGCHCENCRAHEANLPGLR